MDDNPMTECKSKKLLVYDVLKQRIITQIMKPGEPINEGVLSQELEISKTPIREAIQQLEQGKPDLIVLDIVMPVMDGMETLGRIVGKERKIPIILNTSYPGYRDDFMSWAADAYVTKSSDLTQLKDTIKRLLEKGKTR